MAKCSCRAGAAVGPENGVLGGLKWGAAVPTMLFSCLLEGASGSDRLQWLPRTTFALRL